MAGGIGPIANLQGKVDADNALVVSGVVGGGGGTEYTEDAAAAANPEGPALILIRQDTLATDTVSADGDNIAARANSKGELYVKHTDSIAVSADNLDIRDLSSISDSVTAVGPAAHDAAVAGNPVLIGGYASAAAPSAVTDGDAVRAWYGTDGRARVNVIEPTPAATGYVPVRITNATSFTDLTNDPAHDAADTGNPAKIGGRADSTFQTAVADGDRVDALFDVYGHQRVRDDHANRWSYHVNGSSALTDTTVQAAPGAGLSLYVTDIVISLGAGTALNVFFEEGASTVLGPFYLEAVNGRGVVIPFRTPKKITANTALTVTSSAAVAHSIDVQGFIAP